MSTIALFRDGRPVTGEELKRELVLAFIDSWWITNWTSPSIREIGAAMGWSSPDVTHRYVTRLVDQGYLEVKRLSAKRVLYRRATS